MVHLICQCVFYGAIYDKFCDTRKFQIPEQSQVAIIMEENGIVKYLINIDFNHASRGEKWFYDGQVIMNIFYKEHPIDMWTWKNPRTRLHACFRNSFPF